MPLSVYTHPNANVRVVTQCEHKDSGTNPWDKYHEWWVTGQKIKADSIGRSSPHMWSANWFEVRCNNTDCPGLWWIHSEDMINAILGRLPGWGE